MKIRTYAAGSLREYIECISEVSKLIGKEKKDDDITKEDILKVIEDRIKQSILCFPHYTEIENA